jgi:5-deoxy-glucuronate isomerase
VSAHVPHGSTAGDGFVLRLTPEAAGWDFSGLRVLALDPGGARALETGADELVVLPLEGACTVTVDGERFVLDGREGVFAAVAGVVYAPRPTTPRMRGSARHGTAGTSTRACR